MFHHDWIAWQVALRWSPEATLMSLLYEEGSALFCFWWACDLVMRSEDDRDGDLTIHDSLGYDNNVQMILVTCFWHQFWWSVRFSWPGHRTMAISPRYGDYKNCERVGSTKARVNMFQSCRRSQMKDSTCIWKVNESKRFGTNVVTHDFHSIFMYLSYLVCSKRSLQRSHWMSVHPKRGMASWARTWSAVLPPAPGERFCGMHGHVSLVPKWTPAISRHDAWPDTICYEFMRCYWSNSLRWCHSKTLWNSGLFPRLSYFLTH